MFVKKPVDMPTLELAKHQLICRLHWRVGMKIPRQYYSSKQLDRFMKDSLTSEKLFIYIMTRASYFYAVKMMEMSDLY